VAQALAGVTQSPVSLHSASAAKADERLGTGQGELDRVLGGGIVPGSVILLGGDPGIGKSTLLLQLGSYVGRTLRVLYASGEESLGQVAMRAKRIALESSAVRFLADNDLDRVIAAAAESDTQLLLIDSIQTLQSAAVSTAAGGTSQLRECTAALVRFAKARNVAIVIVGHVTKEGTLAGPRVLEHLVDTVLYFESEAGSRYRIVRATKNRFGAVNELGFFAMTESGLREVHNPSAIFLSRATEPAPGSIVTIAREGGRPLLIELQALVDPMRFGAPRRVAQGLDANRIAMLLAVLHRHGGISLQDHDVFVNLVGGIEVGETAWDLAALLALASSRKGRAIPNSVIAFGEIGLTGEVRPVAYGDERLREAHKQGFLRAIVPRENAPRKSFGDLEVCPASSIEESLEIVSVNN
jgi:DNA repair protein RadA/Sms